METLPTDSLQMADDETIAHSEVRNAQVVVTIVSKAFTEPNDFPDLEAELRANYGNRSVAGANPVIQR